MYLRSFSIRGFRNLQPQRWTFPRQTHFIFGDNGQGKTNLLESIYFLCLTKSFRTSEDQECLGHQQDHFSLEACFVDESQVEHSVQVFYQPGAGKSIHLDGKPIHRSSELVGRFPVIKLSQEDLEITNGPPQQRRRFCNILLSQVSVRYLGLLKEYERIVKQRNCILKEGLSGRSNRGAGVEIWDGPLMNKAAGISELRGKMVNELNPLLQALYQQFTDKGDILALEYLPDVAVQKDESYASAFQRRLNHCRRQEHQRGITLIGPHRDDFKFFINEKELRLFGSSGEHKSVAICLKAAEGVLIRRKLDRLPLVLLDDLYAELDWDRGARALQLFSDDLQCFVTGTSFDYQALQSQPAASGQVLWMRAGALERV
ncbi:DNA replication/repair protein RecF [bacterium]|nr:DNA replication/repair protein RecF [bacterium]